MATLLKPGESQSLHRAFEVHEALGHRVHNRAPKRRVVDHELIKCARRNEKRLYRFLHNAFGAVSAMLN
ncbi:MAG: hypothetical protein IPG56_16415 [Caulobacteraceae bacterium]|nr:hypothetical protein [Caulobacteraceae bacterium]